MQNDRLRDFLKFFRFHLAWFILSAGFFAVILISGIFLSTKYVVDTATEQTTLSEPTATPQELELVIPVADETPEVTPTPLSTPSATPMATTAASPIPETAAVTPDQVIERPTKAVTAGKYVVQNGDTLWDIAQSQLGDGHLYTRISQVNGINNPSLIHVGQELILDAVTHGQITEEAWSDDNTVYENYTIIPGDSLWKIAESELGDPYRWVELYQVNKADIGNNPDLIYPNTVIRIPTDEMPISANPYSFNWTSSLLQ